ncbi:2Fe-2S iron-sulfur cluster-binding protein [Vulgatibacter sp.]|uniref:2Fe-2S iron-sulfur cluster-binding protein n=1 Tax=Vulgatibacter sp. TaxID=1971226 RepID=UPI0035623CFF
MTVPRRTLLGVARRAGAPIGYPCRGEGVCGRCTVLITGGATRLAPPGDRERALLAHVGAAPGERLACLAEVAEAGSIDLRVGGGTYRIE